MRQMAAGGVERNAGQHRRIHHLGARLDVRVVIHRAHQIAANAP